MVSYAADNVNPASHAEILYHHAPKIIEQFLDAYLSHDDNANRPGDEILPACIQSNLKQAK